MGRIGLVGGVWCRAGGGLVVSVVVVSVWWAGEGVGGLSGCGRLW